MFNVEEMTEDGEFGPNITVPLGIVISLVIVLALVGNVFTIVAFVKDKKLRTVYNIYIVNLAITDLLLGCISMPFYAVYTLKTYAWPFGYDFCKIYMVADFTLCLEAIIIMIILSLDRFLLLKHGPEYSQRETERVAYIKITISWIISFLLYSPAIIGWDIWTGQDTVEPGDCDVQFAYNFIFTTITAVCEFGIPFICISVINFLIYWQIRKRSKVHGFKMRPSAPIAATNLSTQGPLNTKTLNPESAKSATMVNKDTQRTRAARRDLKAAKSLGLLVAVFAVTWAPYTITTIIISVCESCVNEDLYEFLNWLLWTKAALNPFLYAYNSQRFRENFRSFLYCSRKPPVNMEQTVSTRAD